MQTANTPAQRPSVLSLHGQSSHAMEHMDSAIGEATSVMGAMVTEVIRRSLRGGVLQITQELNTFVAGEVDSAVKEWKPALEQLASEVAQGKATLAAGEAARKQTAHLTEQIEQTTSELTDQIDQAEQRAYDQAINEMNDQVALMRARSRKAASHVKQRILALETATQDMREMLRILDERTSALGHEVTELWDACDQLGESVLELQKPRGIRALLGKLCFWRKRQEPDLVEEEDSED